jgi:hypothetical protein
MPDVQFDENHFANNSSLNKGGGLVNWLIKKRVANNEKDANIKLAVLSLILIIIAFAVPYFFLPHPVTPQVPTTEGHMPPLSAE